MIHGGVFGLGRVFHKKGLVEVGIRRRIGLSLQGPERTKDVIRGQSHRKFRLVIARFDGHRRQCRIKVRHDFRQFSGQINSVLANRTLLKAAMNCARVRIGIDLNEDPIILIFDDIDRCQGPGQHTLRSDGLKQLRIAKISCLLRLSIPNLNGVGLVRNGPRKSHLACRGSDLRIGIWHHRQGQSRKRCACRDTVLDAKDLLRLLHRSRNRI